MIVKIETDSTSTTHHSVDDNSSDHPTALSSSSPSNEPVQTVHVKTPKTARPSFNFTDETLREAEFGIVGSDQKDETHYDNRKKKHYSDDSNDHDTDFDNIEEGYEEEKDDDDDDDDDNDGQGRIYFSSERTLYGRQDELKQFYDAYYSYVTSPDANFESQIIFLSGYSGCGKTRLVNEAVKRFSKNATMKMKRNNKNSHNTNNTRNSFDAPILPMYIHGKYDPLRTPDPYKGISEAFGRWYVNLSLENREVFIHVLYNELIPKVGIEDTLVLVAMIPHTESLLEEIKSYFANGSQHSGSDMLGDSISLGSCTTMSRLIRSKVLDERVNKQRIQHVLRTFLSCLCTEESPLILFLDDLQWADQDTLYLLQSLFSDNALKHVLFVGAYRSNEVQTSSHPLLRTIQAIKSQRRNDCNNSNNSSNSKIKLIELADLSKAKVGQFISDTLNLEVSEVTPLTDAIYSKTLGNMFFTMQALEQLVRKNALYYDMITFQWTWSMSPTASAYFESLLSTDIVEMVQSKIQHMPLQLQIILVVSSYIRSTFDILLLHEILQAHTPKIQPPSKETKDSTDTTTTIIEEEEDPSTSIAPTTHDGDEPVHDWSIKSLRELLDMAVVEGLLKNQQEEEDDEQAVMGIDGEHKMEDDDKPSGDVYSFAHDRIREAASGFLEDESMEQYQLLFHVGHVLARRGMSKSRGEDWMLFTAVHHLNTVPRDNHHKLMKIKSSDSSKSHDKNKDQLKNVDKEYELEMGRLHLATCKLSMSKAAFQNAAKDAQMGIEWLPKDDETSKDSENSWWKQETNLYRELYTLAAESCRSTGDVSEMEKYCRTFLDREEQSQLEVKFQVYYTLAMGLFYGSDRYDEAKKILLNLLKHLNCRFPKSSGKSMMNTVGHLVRLQWTRKKRSKDEVDDMEFMADMEQVEVMKLLDKLFDVSYITGDITLMPLVIVRALDYTLKYGVSIYSPKLIAAAGILFVGVMNDLKGGAVYATYALDLIKKVNHRPIECGATLPCYTFTRHLVFPVSECIKPLRTAYEVGMSTGEIENALWCTFHVLLFVFQAGLPLREIHMEMTKFVPMTIDLSQRFIELMTKFCWLWVLGIMGHSKDMARTEFSESEANNPLLLLLADACRRIELGYSGEYEACADLAIKSGSDFIKMAPGAPMPVMDLFISGVSCLAMIRCTGKSKYKKEFQRIRKWLASWDKQGNPNVRHWMLLYEAESFYLLKKSIQKKNTQKQQEAVANYQEAVEVALKGGYVHDAAVTNDLWGDFACNILGEKDIAIAKWRESSRLFQRWGAEGNVIRLRKKWANLESHRDN